MIPPFIAGGPKSGAAAGGRAWAAGNRARNVTPTGRPGPRTAKVRDMSGELIPDRRDLRASHEDRDEVVEQLRVAAGDGRLTAEELDERLEVALTARTFGELEGLVVDLPTASAGSALAAGSAVPAKDIVQLRSRSGNIQRVGPWTVPRRLDVECRSGNVLIDFTQAVITHPTAELNVAVRSGNLILVVPPGVSVDVDNVSVRSGSIRQHVHHDPAAPHRLLISVSGNIRSGNVRVRGPRRGFLDWLLRRGR